MTTVRAMTTTDYTTVAAISADAVRQALVGRPYWETAAEVQAAVNALPGAEFVVADDPALGVVGVAGYHLGPDGEASLFGPLVTSQGQGIGDFLAERIEAMARQHGANAYAMLIGLQNKSGAAWAQWRGYQPDSEEPETLLTWAYPGELAAPRGNGAHGPIRRARSSDLESIYDLYQACFPSGRLTREEWAGWISQCWVLEEPHGSVTAMMRLEEPAAAFMHHLCVHPSARRQVQGTALVHGVLSDFWWRRPVRVGVAVRLDNSAAVAFFRQMGLRTELPVSKWTRREG